MAATDLPAAADRPAAAVVPPSAALRRWLLVDGLGGYATGAAHDVPLRRYDCWLTVLGPAGRRVRLVAGADECVATAAGESRISAAHWRSLPTPSLAAGARSFVALPLPQWSTAVLGCTIERTLAMARGRRAVFVRWRNRGARPFSLRVRPLLALEDADALSRERPLLDTTQPVEGGWQLASGPGMPLWLSHSAGAVFTREPLWYRDFWFATDAERGYDAVGDRWTPGRLQCELAPDAALTIAFAVDALVDDPAAAFVAAERERSVRVIAAESAGCGLGRRLRAGVDDFFYRDRSGRLGVLAGFPWFGEWGRDVFVALPGLSLAIGEPDRCGEVLRSAVPFLQRGLLPNIYGPTPATSHYDSADAALWFALCVQRWQEHAGADAVRREFGAPLQAIVAAYTEGAALGLCVDSEGLVCAGLPDRNATWMDAVVDGRPVTPRAGQPVEIAALWCSLLLHLGELWPSQYAARASAAGRAFVRRFWRPDARCLFDRVDAGRGDPSIRPNMVIAAALPRSPLSRAERQGVVDTVTRELLTPRGLRTLAPSDPAYHGRYEGGPTQRDEAYHQGTAWPWLLGFYVEAALRAAGATARVEVAARRLAQLQDLVAEVDRGGGAHLAEVFDGEAPQRPGGTFAQAWNTGELLRALRLCREPPQ